ncbi:MAG: superoxide dismutase [Clostridiales bacterium]|jgi:Fe-Mn family superoxide dismutase|nr:superoxide dismutase [Clostridiales bacterium]
MNNSYPFELMALPYDYSALEPSISKTTLEFHHDKHHQTYVNNLNAALAEAKEFHGKSLEEILSNLDKLPSDIVTAVTNNGGGVFNHNFYFEALAAPASTAPSAALAEAIVKAFGSVDAFLAEFKKAALAQFGSGWAWLVSDTDGSLKIVKTPNQETPLKSGQKPLLTIDVWEHAYYLDYQNRRPDYIDAFIKVINWDIVSSRFEALK